jgi:hypothetical protein
MSDCKPDQPRINLTTQIHIWKQRNEREPEAFENFINEIMYLVDSSELGDYNQMRKIAIVH